MPEAERKMIERLSQEVELLKHQISLLQNESSSDQKQYRSIVENQNDFVVRMNQQGRLLFASPSFLKCNALHEDDLCAVRMLDLIEPEDLMKVYRAWIEVRRAPYCTTREIRHMTPRGARWIQWSGRTILRDREPVEIIGVGRDITDQKNMELSLKNSERNFRESIDKSPLGIRIVTPEGDTIYANEAILNMYGYESLEDLTRTPVQERYTRESYAEHLERKVKRKKGKSSTDVYEVSIRRKNGEIRFLQVSRKEIIWDGIDCYQAVYQDITDLKLLHWELVKAKENAEESDRLKSTFLANLSHEIRTPMNAITGFSELLKDASLSHYERLYYIDIINKNSFYLLSLISDILEISKIETGQVGLYYSIVSLEAFMKEIIHGSTLNIPADHPVDFRYQCHESIHNLTVFLDEEKLKRVLHHLVSNALKYTEEGSVEVRCRVNEGSQLTLTVRDTGIGIQPEHQEKIFDRFWQEGDFLRSSKRGAGLGLAICKAYVEMMGGNITVDSTPGEGSVFTVTIPLCFDKNCSGKKQQTSQKKTGQFGSGVQILVAEDDDLNYFYLAALFSGSQYTLIRAGNGQEAVRICRSNPEIRLVLMDIRMPVMDGFEAFSQIRKICPDLPVIAQTAYALTDNKEQIRNAGFDGYITKPIKKDILFQVIGVYLSHEK